MMASILLVDDDPLTCKLLSTLLACKGHLVDTAEDAGSALRMAHDKRYDLAFVDYHLPQMDEDAIWRLARLLTETADSEMKMVALTADLEGLKPKAGVDVVFDGMLSKPINVNTLYAFLAEALLQIRWRWRPASR
jgi:CheY-like chemotaxis protein